MPEIGDTVPASSTAPEAEATDVGPWPPNVVPFPQPQPVKHTCPICKKEFEYPNYMEISQGIVNPTTGTYDVHQGYHKVMRPVCPHCNGRL